MEHELLINENDPYLKSGQYTLKQYRVHLFMCDKRTSN
jgi:hypothetical protein